jgi:hypothetical protein
VVEDSQAGRDKSRTRVGHNVTVTRFWQSGQITRDIARAPFRGYGSSALEDSDGMLFNIPLNGSMQIGV